MGTTQEDEQQQTKVPKWPRLTKFTLSACAAAVAELVTFPLDLTKTRLQVQGEAAARRAGTGGAGSGGGGGSSGVGSGGGASSGAGSGGGSSRAPQASYRGMMHTAIGIVQEEGPLKLWQGVTPAIYRHVVYSGGRMLAYEQLRESVLGRNQDGSFPLWKAVVGGMAAGAVGQFLASPTDLVKVQMQMEGRRLLEGKEPRVRGATHAFVKIFSEGGVRGLWAGWVPNVQRAALVNLGDLTTYDTVKHFLLRNTPIEDNSLCHALASICSGLVAATMGTPADVVKTRIMNQPRDAHGRLPGP
ncbi:mitochondrial uncoupling protein 4 isoform X1 [Engraulis encrasicolus]|uniref:mitochondrial uncoupling protein 4 isoform X1 n=1 Tax=Engraulis encrasicolus TaxID=184585 RepID=UPI002FD1CE9C